MPPAFVAYDLTWYVVPQERPATLAEKVVAILPATDDPYEMVVPYWKPVAVIPEPEAIVPVKVAPVWVMEETVGPDVEVGVQAVVVNAPSEP